MTIKAKAGRIVLYSQKIHMMREYLSHLTPLKIAIDSFDSSDELLTDCSQQTFNALILDFEAVTTTEMTLINSIYRTNKGQGGVIFAIMPPPAPIKLKGLAGQKDFKILFKPISIDFFSKLIQSNTAPIQQRVNENHNIREVVSSAVKETLEPLTTNLIVKKVSTDKDHLTIDGFVSSWLTITGEGHFGSILLNLNPFMIEKIAMQTLGHKSLTLSFYSQQEILNLCNEICQIMADNILINLKRQGLHMEINTPQAFFGNKTPFDHPGSTPVSILTFHDKAYSLREAFSVYIHASSVEVCIDTAA